jgi:hypothetical protein
MQDLVSQEPIKDQQGHHKYKPTSLLARANIRPAVSLKLQTYHLAGKD